VTATAVTVARGDWLLSAACRDLDPGWWELVGEGWRLTDGNRAAIRICHTCPVERDCAAATLRADVGVIRAGQPLRIRRADPLPAPARNPGRHKRGGDIPHGTWSGYCNHGCACVPCTQAGARYREARKAAVS
jgi:hypothetical protein